MKKVEDTYWCSTQELPNHNEALSRNKEDIHSRTTQTWHYLAVQNEDSLFVKSISLQ